MTASTPEPRRRGQEQELTAAEQAYHEQALALRAKRESPDDDVMTGPMRTPKQERYFGAPGCAQFRHMALRMIALIADRMWSEDGSRTLPKTVRKPALTPGHAEPLPDEPKQPKKRRHKAKPVAAEEPEATEEAQPDGTAEEPAADETEETEGTEE